MMGAICSVTGLKQGSGRHSFAPACRLRAFTASGSRGHMLLSDAANCKRPHTGALVGEIFAASKPKARGLRAERRPRPAPAWSTAAAPCLQWPI
ncbi:hypothetical protein MPLB_280040 [Mesorhizobium sp. ORS 3324]|nr:hypothetical protein MPLB_280040 [Mesorhizobium sp. ORS 3324]